MDRFSTLFQRFVSNSCTDEEKKELFDMIARSEYDPALKDMIDSEINDLTEETAVPEDKAAAILSLILQTGTPAKKRSRVLPILYWSAAAIMMLAVGLITFYTINNKTTKRTVVAQTPVKDVLPATQGAVLTLSDGSTVVLENVANGQLTQQGNSNVIKQNDGRLVYNHDGGTSGKPLTIDHSPLTYNTLATPRGRIFQLVLPDGSTVWLNAASSIKYPTSFTGAERVVELTGEAYFEVIKDAHKPFHVKTASQDVEVLGTHFNVNAYSNEASVKTTLLEGSVKVKSEAGSRKSENSVILKPGEQSELAAANSPFTIDHSPNVEQIMSWKNGIFNFENADIKTVMRQLERWYNIEVVYEQGVPAITFGGKMGRDLTLTNVLRILQISKVHFRMEQDNKLIVTP